MRQYLALAGTLDTSSGGVTDLSGNFAGLDLRATTRFAPAGRPLTLTVGAAYDRQRQARKGFVNNNGALGDLRRDEDDSVRNQDAYAQARMVSAGRLVAAGRGRYSDVRFDSVDHYSTALNPDDSGRVAFSHASPVGGIVWRAAKDINVYANWGEGFETPTFIELAYRNAGTGLNFALRPAISRSTEIGVKAYFAETQRVNLAAFITNTSNEIIIDAATGGRTTYKNAGKTRRRGVEAQWEGALGGGLTGYAAYTYLSATFAEDTTTGTPPLLVPSGVAAALRCRPPAPTPSRPGRAPTGQASRSRWKRSTRPSSTSMSANTDAAPAYTVANVRAGFEQRVGDKRGEMLWLSCFAVDSCPRQHWPIANCVQRECRGPADAGNDDCRDVGGGKEHAAEDANQCGDLYEDETGKLKLVRRQRTTGVASRGTGHHAHRHAADRAYGQCVNRKRLGNQPDDGKCAQHEVDDNPAVSRVKNPDERRGDGPPWLPEIESASVRDRGDKRHHDDDAGRGLQQVGADQGQDASERDSFNEWDCAWLVHPVCRCW